MTQSSLNEFLYPHLSKQSIDSLLFVFDHQQFSPKLGQNKWHVGTLYFTAPDEVRLMNIADRLDNGELVSIFEYPSFDKYELQILKRLVAAPEHDSKCDKFEFGYHVLESIKLIETLIKALNTANKYVTYVSSSIYKAKYGKILIDILQKYGESVFYRNDWYKVFAFDSIDKCEQAQQEIFAFLKTDFKAPSYMWQRIKDLSFIIKQLKKVLL